MDYFDSVFRSLDEPTGDDDRELQEMCFPTRAERQAAVLANSEGFCYLCDREVGVENLVVANYHASGSLKPFCVECRPFANLPHWLIEYAVARSRRWRDKIQYEASERAKAAEQKKRGQLYTARNKRREQKAKREKYGTK